MNGTPRGAVEVDVTGATVGGVTSTERLVLWPGRGAGWPGGGVLFVADPHFGKAAAFRAAGIAAPEGTAADLERLDEVLGMSGARRLVVLGDFLHARSGRSESVLAALREWRARHAELDVTLVRGNHDRGAGDPPRDLGIECVEGPWNLGPFRCRHEPAESGDETAGFELAGHVHPGVILRERRGGGLRAPCFVVGSRRALLPAFGGFTGMHPVERRPGDRLFAVGPGVVVEV